MPDMLNQNFNRLTVIAITKDKQNRALWVCKCECGTIKTILATMVRNNYIKSCGCLQRDFIKTNLTKHGLCKAPEYWVYHHMIQRCTNPKSQEYRNYGGRGITVCEQWQNSFPQFMQDMGQRPSKHHSLDRIDNNKGYSPDNCRWATPIQQANNMRTNHLIEYNGEQKSLTQWAKQFNLHPNTFKKRLYKLHWNIHEALTTPPSSGGYKAKKIRQSARNRFMPK